MNPLSLPRLWSLEASLVKRILDPDSSIVLSRIEVFGVDDAASAQAGCSQDQRVVVSEIESLGNLQSEIYVRYPVMGRTS